MIKSISTILVSVENVMKYDLEMGFNNAAILKYQQILLLLSDIYLLKDAGKNVGYRI